VQVHVRVWRLVGCQQSGRKHSTQCEAVRLICRHRQLAFVSAQQHLSQDCWRPHVTVDDRMRLLTTTWDCWRPHETVDDHMWLSVGMRAKPSSFTRAQRLGTCMATLFLLPIPFIFGGYRPAAWNLHGNTVPRHDHQRHVLSNRRRCDPHHPSRRRQLSHHSHRVSASTAHRLPVQQIASKVERPPSAWSKAEEASWFVQPAASILVRLRRLASGRSVHRAVQFLHNPLQFRVVSSKVRCVAGGVLLVVRRIRPHHRTSQGKSLIL